MIDLEDTHRARAEELRFTPLRTVGAGPLTRRAPDERRGPLVHAMRAIALGAPGAPCFVVGDQLFWGQDRLEFVGKALRGWRVPDTGSRISARK